MNSVLTQSDWEYEWIVHPLFFYIYIFHVWPKLLLQKTPWKLQFLTQIFLCYLSRLFFCWSYNHKILNYGSLKKIILLFFYVFIFFFFACINLRLTKTSHFVLLYIYNTIVLYISNNNQYQHPLTLSLVAVLVAV